MRRSRKAKMYTDLPVCREWQDARRRHPAVSEGYDINSAEYWEGCSAGYSSERYDVIKEQIIDHLSNARILGKDRTLLDVGSGPGTFAVPMSRSLKKITCMDIAPGMISRIDDICGKESIHNIDTFQSDWLRCEHAGRYDIVFSALCPAMNDPSSILKMEEHAERDCVYLSSINDEKTIHLEICDRIGKDFSFEGYNTEYPFRFLKEMGREPEMKVFSERFESKMSAEKMIESEIRALSNYSEIPGLRDTVEETVLSHAVDGIIHTVGSIRMGLLIWKPITNGADRNKTDQDDLMTATDE
ncbi:MAG: class I SAM-dependent methyltransferase [Candidatus Methanomethylophilaceae archaeon]